MTGMIEWSQKSRPKNPLSFHQNPKKFLDQKLTPKKSHANFVALTVKVPEKGNTTGHADYIRHILDNMCDVKRHHDSYINNCKTRLFVLYLKNYVARAPPILFNTPKKIPYSNQATRKNTCQISVPKKIPESIISTQKNPLIIPIT